MNAFIERVARTTPVPLTLRVVVFLGTLLGLWLAAPAQASEPRVFLLMAFFSALPGIFPGTRVVDTAMVSAVIIWVGTTLFVGEPAEPLRVFGIASALYVSHSAAALAAVLPYDAVVDSQVLLRWTMRSALVIIGGGMITAAVVWIARAVTPGTSILVVLAGVGIAVATVAILTRRTP